ncbi:toxin-antitoxin system YwqK family antitoxin [[Mycoplasma] anseris]|uniref:Uncharacterized protein n=1 Tax=[Mycoplasma] anseris TaxID=92400 RepID=A0A2Z4NDP0_9BACT|nr:hypothetical protein [[Mycoplasma] anseris]AWX69628.1 hypothetical protein DP065_02645 [[Mycoplasma] anseris]
MHRLEFLLVFIALLSVIAMVFNLVYGILIHFKNKIKLTKKIRIIMIICDSIVFLGFIISVISIIFVALLAKKEQIANKSLFYIVFSIVLGLFVGYFIYSIFLLKKIKKDRLETLKKINKTTFLEKHYYKNGNLHSEIPYLDNYRHGNLKIYYLNGNLYSETYYQFDLKNGPDNIYYENGALEQTTFFENDKKQGPQITYNEQGIEIKRVYFWKNKKISLEKYNYLNLMNKKTSEEI